MDNNKLDVKKLISKLGDEIKKEKDGLVKDEMLLRLIEEAKAYNGEDKVVPFMDVYKRLKTQPPVYKINTGWVELDKLLKGIRKKHLIVWGGITKHGKTTLAMDLTCHLKEYNPLWLPIEESAEELMEKFIERGEEPPVGFSPENIGFVDTIWIEKKIFESKVKYMSKIVIIDNLSWVNPSNVNKFDNKSDRVEQTVMQIKAIAKKLNIPIILIVHVNKESKVELNPTFENFKGSSGISQIADKALLIWRQTKKGVDGQLEISDNVNVSVQLNRQGKTGNVKMVFENGKYTEQEWKSDTEQAEEDLKNF